MNLALLVPAVLFPALWAGVSLANARASGWTRLARRYTTRRAVSPSATDFGRGPGRVGEVSMRGMLAVAAETDGLRVSVTGPMQLGRPALLLPWDELTVTGHDTQDAHPVVTLAVGRATASERSRSSRAWRARSPSSA